MFFHPSIRPLCFLLAALCSLASTAFAADRYSLYIETYSDMARAEMMEFGIPASITLAQGLLESAAGASTLAKEGNNHFGIKCHNTWTGPSMLRSDDAPDECFRVYDNASESFRDHSLFLSRKRYAPLFLLSPTDYAAWAAGLKQCGYATDPHYADRLVAIIERYELYRFDFPSDGEAGAEFIKAALGKTRRICRYRGLHYVVATPGDTYNAIAAELGMTGEKLALLNDAPSPDCEVRPWQEVYLQPKFETGPEGQKSAVIGIDESLHSVAQRFAISLDALRKLNPKAADRPGQKLKLQ